MEYIWLLKLFIRMINLKIYYSRSLVINSYMYVYTNMSKKRCCSRHVVCWQIVSPVFVDVRQPGMWLAESESWRRLQSVLVQGHHSRRHCHCSPYARGKHDGGSSCTTAGGFSALRRPSLPPQWFSHPLPLSQPLKKKMHRVLPKRRLYIITAK
jgi:hypothetical protein